MQKSLIIMRDILQMKILLELFKNTKKNALALKGGMALRVLKQIRYTQDIDLQGNPEIHYTTMQERVKKSIETALLSTSLKDVKITVPKGTDTVLRWKIGAVISDTNEEIHMKVEISRRGFPNAEQLTSLNYSPPDEYGLEPIAIDIYKMPLIFATKIDALMNPNRTAVRDLFDLSMLVENGIKPDLNLVSMLIDKEGVEQTVGKMWVKINSMTYEMFQQELLPYVQKHFLRVYDNPEKYMEMQLNVGTELEKLFRETQENTVSAEFGNGR